MDYTTRAVEAITEAIRGERDLPGWLSLVLVLAAAQTGSLDDLTAGRPGSWEAELVDRLARGLAFDDEHLAAFAVIPRRGVPDPWRDEAPDPDSDPPF